MRAVMLMFDSLNRHFLAAYGHDEAIAPNFARLARRAVTFERSYVGSMPCMPARRELHTGRHNFLHNSWSPLEPFDDSLPELLRARGVYSHMVTDHYHYLEDNGTGYLQRYDTWEAERGQEGDACIGLVGEPEIPEHINGKGKRQDWVNRPFFADDEHHYQTRTIDRGLDFIRRNAAADDWFLQIECFDPHEPFSCDPRWKVLYPDDYDGPLFDWPGYRPVTETPEQIAHIRNNYRALLSKCDESLGRVLDAFDEHNLWADTMFVLWTDHGFLLGEHQWWAKNAPPLYEEVSHTPFFVYDPRCPDRAGQRRRSLVQPAVDLAPTLLRFFGAEPTPDMVAGHDLAAVIADDEPVRAVAIFGYHGKALNVTDGRWVCYREIQDETVPCHRYTVSLAAARKGGLTSEDLRRAEWQPGFGFTKGWPVFRVPAGVSRTLDEYGATWLYDLEADPRQERRVEDPAVVERLLRGAGALMRAHEAPQECYARWGMPG